MHRSWFKVGPTVTINWFWSLGGLQQWYYSFSGILLFPARLLPLSLPQASIFQMRVQSRNLVWAYPEGESEHPALFFNYRDLYLNPNTYLGGPSKSRQNDCSLHFLLVAPVLIFGPTTQNCVPGSNRGGLWAIKKNNFFMCRLRLLLSHSAA